MSYDPASIEARWRDRWRQEGYYEADPEDDGDATFITVPYPYPSGGMHVGHARTYTVPDVYARYRRLQGDNVLFPIAWHVTGTPIIGAVERLKKGEEEQLSVLRDTYNVPEDTLQDLETPMGFARYFIEEHYKKGMQQLGLSVDWRREFTTNDERYSKFITWQYRTLKERGLLEKGLHPVKFCTNENNPVTTHDLLEGEEAEFQEYTLVRFRDSEGTVLPMATLRPETVRGVTNAFVDPDGEYVRAEVDGEEWVVSAQAAEKLRLQDHEVEVVEELGGAELVGERVTNPITDDEVLILPASFVDTDNATGVVMSVPAHSPDDYMALQEAKERADEMTEYGIDPDEVRAIEPVPILTIEGYGEIPARDAVEEYDVQSQDDPALEEATQELYNREFHQGKLIDAYGEYAGETVEDVRERFREDYKDRGAFGSMQEFTEEVICRCGGAVEVAKQETWFLRYNDEDWKAKTKRLVEGLDAIPDNTREQYTHTVDWLNEWPCIRNYGLGTRLPWDEDFVIEPLSDSTIYMAYYTIAHRLDDIPPEEMDQAFFDTLFYGADAVEDPDERALSLREEWDHWYPVDYRVSANDLISNHLTFYLYHHAELFDERNWPEGITIMGMGLLEGQKMSSSKGHVVLPGEAIDEYGADTVRFFLLNSAEPWQDYDWRDEAVSSAHGQLRRFYNRATEVIEQDAPDDQPDLRPIDEWLLSKLQGVVREATEALEGFETRTASQAAFYAMEEHLRWYRRRADMDREGARWTLRHVLSQRLRLLAPFTPYLTNELHEELAGESAETAGWPDVDEAREDPTVEVRESLVESLTDDINDIVDVTGTDPEVVRVYTAADWKRSVFEQVVETGPDVGAVMSEVMSDPDLRERGNEVNQLVQELVEFVREQDDDRLAILEAADEADVYADAVGFYEREFDADVRVLDEGADPDDPGDKAGDAVPFRPAIHIE
ncbi:leucine--tRNA ligase [Haloglomus halophilum]|uniref:leucine--tRNA ligase n=1 Tax=Haloglomus halophilum TaxID=2962672 RepID=UPI0020CA1E6A|nr:leucine--tRNA ligase [Haloglomus halophilum]